jgi:hypothetical protein
MLTGRYEVEIVDTSGDMRVLDLCLDSYKSQSDAFLCIYSPTDINSLYFLQGMSVPAVYDPMETAILGMRGHIVWAGLYPSAWVSNLNLLDFTISI